MSVQDHGNTHPIAVAKRSLRAAEEGPGIDRPAAALVALGYAMLAVAEAIADAAEKVRNG